MILNPVQTGPARQLGGVGVGSPVAILKSTTGQPSSGVMVEIIYSGDDMYFEQDFTVPSSTWAITHNFGKSPNVRIIDHNGNTAYPGTQDSEDLNTVYVTWPTPMTGKAVCS